MTEHKIIPKTVITDAITVHEGNTIILYQERNSYIKFIRKFLSF